MTREEFKLEAVKTAREIKSLTGFHVSHTSDVAHIIYGRFANVIADGESAAEAATSDRSVDGRGLKP